MTYTIWEEIHAERKVLHAHRCALVNAFTVDTWVETPSGIGRISYVYTNGFALVWHPQDQAQPRAAGEDPSALGCMETHNLYDLGLLLP